MSANEFVIRFSNVNGTGSASANGMVAKSFYRLGIPFGAKNMFPSNIQGLPTWYEIRVSEQGFTGRRGGVDLMVAMNAQTFAKDNADVSSGGYLLYDSSRHISNLRTDIEYLKVPFTELTRDVFANPKSRGMLKNMVYVGSLAAFLDIDVEVYKDLVRAQFAKKPKLFDENFKALDIGYDYAKKNYKCPLRIRVQKPKDPDKVKKQILIGGNEAAGLGCVYAGATVAAWYPITPSTSLVDAFGKYCQKLRVDAASGKNKFAILQAEDEIAAIGMVLGASWNGARAFTATSGPGISLMSEFIGYAFYGEIPAVIFNIQRCGPSTGMPTRTQQADLMLCAYASHGDTKHVMLFPSTPKECFEMAVNAFDLAERLQTVVFVMSDLELGMNDYLCDPLQWDDAYKYDRGKVLDKDALGKMKDKFYRYLDVDGDGIPYRTLPGVDAKAAYFTRGSGHDKYGRYTEDGELYKENLDRINKKFDFARKNLLPKAQVTTREAKQKTVAVIAFGTTYEPLYETMHLLSKQKIVLNDLRLRSFPFGEDVEKFCEGHGALIVVEQNRDAQLAKLLTAELGIDPERIRSVLIYDGLPVTAEFLSAEIKRIWGELK